MVAGAVVERPLAFVVSARLEPCPRAVALGVADDQQQLDEAGGHRIAGGGKHDLSVLVEIGTRGAIGGDLAQRREGIGRRRRTPRVVDEHRAQTLTDATDEVEVGGPEFGVGRQQATGHQPRLCLAWIGKPVRASGQLDGVDQRLNAAQRAGRRLGFDVGGPVWQRHGFILGRRDQ